MQAPSGLFPGQQGVLFACPLASFALNGKNAAAFSPALDELDLPSLLSEREEPEAPWRDPSVAPTAPKISISTPGLEGLLCIRGRPAGCRSSTPGHIDHLSNVGTRSART